MAQFRVYRNPRTESKARFPLLLDIQSDLLDQLDTRVVVPLAPVQTRKARAISVLMPELEVEGRRYVMVTPQMAGVPRGVLGAEVAEVTASRQEIVAAIDLLVTGI